MSVDVANGHFQRLCGLIGRRPDPDRALLLPKTRSVHTFGVRGTLDLVWLDAGNVVVRVDEAVPPMRVRGCRAARSVLECPTGEWRALLAQL